MFFVFVIKKINVFLIKLAYQDTREYVSLELTVHLSVGSHVASKLVIVSQ